MKHGGARKGAGKPAQYGTAMKRVNVMLDQATIEFYTQAGNGNLSAGIREHWRSLTQRVPDAANSWRCRCGWANDDSVKLCSACGTQRR